MSRRDQSFRRMSQKPRLSELVQKRRDQNAVKLGIVTKDDKIFVFFSSRQLRKEKQNKTGKYWNQDMEQKKTRILNGYTATGSNDNENALLCSPSLGFQDVFIDTNTVL